MPVREMQHQRLRHLFAGAILEQWKKETGSVTSVLIEGTVCVTVHGGRTTVVQLSERFSGLVCGDDGDGRGYCGDRQPAHMTPSTPSKTSNDNKSRVRATSPTVALKDSNNNERNVETSPPDDDFIIDDDDDDDVRSTSALMDDDESSSMDVVTVPGPTIAGTGFYTPDRCRSGDSKLEAYDSAIHDMTLNSTLGSPPSRDVSTKSSRRGSAKTSTSSSAMTSNGCSDLLLSSPHDYTAQVRNVIRQRLLNTSSKATPPASSSLNFPGTTSGFDTSGCRPPTSPFFRPGDASSVSPWIKAEMPLVAATDAMASAARRLMMSQYAAAAAAAASGHVPLTLMSPPPAGAMSVGMPLSGVPLNAPLHSQFGLKSPSAISATATSTPTPATTTPKRSASTSSSGGEPATSASSDGQTPSSEQKIYRCDYCFKTFLFKSKYHEHLPVHTSARPFQCHLCTRTYKYKYDLRVHLRTHLGIPTKSTVCPFCAGRFATNKVLRLHMREAHAEQNGPNPHVQAVVAAAAAAAAHDNSEISNDRPLSSPSTPLNDDDDVASRPEPEVDSIVDDDSSLSPQLSESAVDATVKPVSECET